MNKLLAKRNAGKVVVHSPNTWVSVLDSGKKHNNFTHAEWKVWFCQSTGVDNPQVTECRKKGKDQCGGCRKTVDSGGHHLQCCNTQHKGTWQEVHDELQETWVGLACEAGF